MLSPSVLLIKGMQKISFREHILPLKDKLYRLALRMTMNREEAEDIVQETLVKAWRKQDDWLHREEAEAFCWTAARNMAIDSLRRSEIRNEGREDEDRAAEIPDTRVPDADLEEREREQLVRQLIGQLPLRQRTVLHLREVEEMSYRQIAEVMQLSENQVKVELHRARLRIRKRFNEIDRYGL